MSQHWLPLHLIKKSGAWVVQVLHQLVEVSAKAATRDAASLTSDLLPTLLEKVHPAPQCPPLPYRHQQKGLVRETLV